MCQVRGHYAKCDCPRKRQEGLDWWKRVPDRDDVIAGTNQKRDDVIGAKSRFWDRGLWKNR